MPLHGLLMLSTFMPICRTFGKHRYSVSHTLLASNEAVYFFSVKSSHVLYQENADRIMLTGDSFHEASGRGIICAASSSEYIIAAGSPTFSQ